MVKTLDENTVVELEEVVETEEIEEVEESKIKALVVKAKNGAKTNGKKIVKKVAKGAILFTGGLVIGALARGKKDDGDEHDYDDSFTNPVDVDFVEINETTTE